MSGVPVFGVDAEARFVRRLAGCVANGDDLVCVDVDLAAAVISEMQRRAALVKVFEETLKAKNELIDILTQERNLWEFEARRG